jgi:hypothetical protein
VTIDSGDVSRYTSIAIDSNGKIHISYRYEANANFIYACCESNCHIQDNWQIDPIEACFGWHGSLAIDNNNNPHLSYSEGGNLKYVYKFEDNWTAPQTVTCSNYDVQDTSIALDNSGNPFISFYDYFLNYDLGLAFIDVDSDNDGIAEAQDNCPSIPNGPCLSVCYTWEEMIPCTTDTDCVGTGGFCSMNQKDTYPPERNGIGDACDCEGDFDCDGDCDGTDASAFKTDFGRSPFGNPCEADDPCNGDFDCDNDCDGSDASLFKEDFGRSLFGNPCPIGVVGEWCAYQ